MCNKDLERLAYIVSHDLKSPLVYLKGFVAELETDCDKIHKIVQDTSETFDSEQKKNLEGITQKNIPKYLKFINLAVKELESINDAVLELSRNCSRTLKFEKIDSYDFVKSVLTCFHDQIETKNIHLVIDNLPEVIADRKALHDIFFHIIDHAIKNLLSDQPGIIQISGKENETESTFWVQHNGRGISESALQKFFQISKLSSDPNKAGAGIGMAFVKQLVLRHNGWVKCESLTNQETVLTFTLEKKLSSIL